MILRMKPQRGLRIHKTAHPKIHSQKGYNVMQMKKFCSAFTAACLTAGALLGTGAFPSAAAEAPVLTFDIRSDGKNAVSIKAADIAARDISVPVKIYIPSNPGVNGINLKLQVNDGEPDAETGAFGNYGLYLADGAMASPFCFDSASKGNAGTSFSEFFTPSRMNLSWVYSADPDKLPDAAAEANTTAWDATVDWAYQNAFATATLIVPKGTPAGDYTLDVRKDPYVNAQSIVPGSSKESRSECSGVSTSSLSFNSVPLKVTVEEVDNSDWKDTYEIADEGYYYIIGDVAGKPGDTVKVPVYVFNDIGTAGGQYYFDIDKHLKLNKFDRSNAFRVAPTTNTDLDYPSYVFAGSDTMQAENGSVLCYLNVTIPETAKAGDIFKAGFYHEGLSNNGELKVVDIDTEKLDVAFYDGSVTVIADDQTCINRSSVSLSGADQYANLTLFNVTGPVEWKSEDPSVATVDQNGFIKSVGYGSTKITATNQGKEYVCSVSVGLLGDVDRNGAVDVVDAQNVLRHYVEVFAGKPPVLKEEVYPVADINGDGKIEILDVQYILIYYVNNTVSKKTVSWEEIIGA